MKGGGQELQAARWHTAAQTYTHTSTGHCSMSVVVSYNSQACTHTHNMPALVDSISTEAVGADTGTSCWTVGRLCELAVAG